MDYDMNINNYDTEELFTLIGCSPENRTTECINDKINDMQKNLKETDADDNKLLKFIDNIKIRLLESLEDTSNNREYNIEIVKGDINPNFNNTVTRLINIDSQFKEIINENNNDTSKFTFEFSETLTKVTKFSLHSLEIPYSWYTFDPAYGTTTVKINNVDTDISAGNYTPETLVAEINRVFQNITASITASIIESTGKVKIENTTQSDINLIFYSESFSNSKKNSNLGWLLGFRLTSYTLPKNGSIVSESLCNPWGTRYIYLVLDDYNNNKSNSCLCGISRPDHSLTKPSRLDHVVDTIPNADGTHSIAQLTSIKTMTNAEINAYNYIINDNNINKNARFNSPTASDVIAKLPIKITHDWKNYQGFPLIEYSGQFQKHERIYFGPVNLTRMTACLLDDKGRQLNLNGMDWSFSITTTHVYQY